MGAMRISLFNGFLAAALLLPPLALELGAQEEDRQVEVQNVRFGNAQPAGTTRRWREVAVQLNVRGPADREAVNPSYVDDVEVTVHLSFEVSRGEVERMRFYRSSVDLPTLERGRHTVRFFLPPEIVGRDRATGEPTAYEALVAVGGVEQEPTSRSRSSLLESDSVRESFRNRLEREAGGNDGILLPQHLTPFLNDPQYLRDMPSVRRSEAE